jgi:nitronate monooxygenase
MGGVAGGRLAAAVSAAGGFGLVGGGYGDVAWLRRELDAAGAWRIGAGFITFALDGRPEVLDIALERQPPAVQLSFGDPSAYSERIHDAGALLICQVQTVAEARRAVEAGADVVVAQGQDAGGHGRSGRGVMGLVPAVVDAVSPIPVVAAGGIGDGRGLAAALLLGATGVSLGTRLYASREAISDEQARAALVAASGDDTVRTPAFDVVRGPAWPAGYDGRVLRNRTVERWDAAAGDPETVAALAEQYRAAPEDDYQVKALWAGEAVGLVDRVDPVEHIVGRIIAEAAEALDQVTAHMRRV